MDKIVDHLYLSDWDNSIDKCKLEKNKIKCIIDITMILKYPVDLEIYKQLDIKYIHIKEHDNAHTNLSKYFDLTNNIINKCVSMNKNILIHCFVGRSRSPTIIIAYLLFNYYKRNKSTMDCKSYNPVLPMIILFVRSKRNIINPNKEFILQLMRYEYYLFKK